MTALRYSEVFSDHKMHFIYQYTLQSKNKITTQQLGYVATQILLQEWAGSHANRSLWGQIPEVTKTNLTTKSKFSYTRAAALNSDVQMHVANNTSLL